MNIEHLLMRLDIGEDQDIEFKAAEGGLPKSLWETISAFANTEGGYIVLGVAEKDQKAETIGVRNPEGLLKTFWDAHNNTQKLSTPMCSERDITRTDINGRTLLIILVPQASRSQRPVYINGNPLTGTFKRNFEGDYHCTEAEVRQMLRDTSDDAQDGMILEGYGVQDLDEETIKAFRNRFASREPDHPFLGLDDKAFLERLGGWRRDRKTNLEGVTLAGLLMFGRERNLLDALPHYHLDYQEQLSDDPEVRWTYRLTLDGKWEPNLFNFYYRVYPRLVDGLDVPFKLDRAATRLGETHVHEALREAIVNTLIHADHQSSRPITIIKRREVFIFMNPGRLRIPREVLYQGGVSDPRNPNLQKMFQMLGLGEKAGSGFQKILRAWKEQHWMIPLVAEQPVLEMTRVHLPIASMIPEDVEKELRSVVGDAYSTLNELDRVILMLAHRFGEIGNADIQPYRREHPKDIGESLKHLVEKRWLDKTGHGRGTRYRLPGTRPLELFSGLLEANSEHYVQRSEHYEADSEHLSSEHYTRLEGMAKAVREKGRVSKELMKEILLALCSEGWLSLRTLARLLGREPDTLRNHYINPMLREDRLEARFPTNPNHPEQAYMKKRYSR